MTLKLTFESKSDVGLERSENQDFFGSKSVEGFDFFIVCDGMGGHAGGSHASRLGVMTIEEKLEAGAELPIEDRIEDAILDANAAIHAKSRRRRELRGMGTTVVLLGIDHSTEQAYLAHVGDSRIYRLRGNTFERLTKDHTMVQRLIDDGILTEEAAENRPNANVISRSLGGRDHVEVELGVKPLDVKEGDIFVLCSDGLFGLVKEPEIAETVATYAPREACDILVQRAREEGGHDNITVEIILVGEQQPAATDIVLKHPPPGPPSEARPRPERRKPAKEEAAAAAAPAETPQPGAPKEGDSALPAPGSKVTPVDPPKAVNDESSSGFTLIAIVLFVAIIIVVVYTVLGSGGDDDAAPPAEGPSMSAPADEEEPPEEEEPVSSEPIVRPILDDPDLFDDGSGDYYDDDYDDDGSGEGSGGFGLRNVVPNIRVHAEGTIRLPNLNANADDEDADEPATEPEADTPVPEEAPDDTQAAEPEPADEEPADEEPADDEADEPADDNEAGGTDDEE